MAKQNDISIFRSTRPSLAQEEISRGERFSFGGNWRAFLDNLGMAQIATAEAALREMTGRESLEKLRFLDAGSGSGLFSLAARRLGATVFSFDFDAESVDCACALKNKFFPSDERWQISTGSVLDPAFLQNIGSFDIVYSWGVLHHTGDLWSAFDNVSRLVAPGGSLVVAIYRDQGFASKCWRVVKKCYCRGKPGRALVCGAFLPLFFAKKCLECLVNRENAFRAYRKQRGMAVWHDWIDWLGGYPFEVARIPEVLEFAGVRGLTPVLVKEHTSWGNNEFVLQKAAAD